METGKISELEKKLTEAVKKCLAENKKTAAVFSGGIDSSLISFLAYRQGAAVTAFTVGLVGSPDVEFVREHQKELPFTSLIKEVDQAQMSENLPRIKKALKKAGLEFNLMQVSLAMGTYLALKEIKKKGFELVLSGQGSDEIFGGYFKALKIPAEELNKHNQGELARLKASDFKRENVLSEELGLEMRYPFLEPEVVEFALNLAPEWKLKKEGEEVIRKYILRQVAARLGLPAAIVNRPKAAFQYSSRIQRELIKIAKREKIEFEKPALTENCQK